MRLEYQGMIAGYNLQRAVFKEADKKHAADVAINFK
jgi:hypothetical protein